MAFQHTSAAETNESVDAMLNVSRRLNSSVLSFTVISVFLSLKEKGGKSSLICFLSLSSKGQAMVTKHNHKNVMVYIKFFSCPCDGFLSFIFLITEIPNTVVKCTCTAAVHP